MPRILIADDEDSMRALVARAIAMDGHDTVTAQDGAEALEILTREHGAFDLLLTDIQMPVMDGIALALSAARDFPQADDPADDGLCRSARTRLQPQRHRARRDHQAVFGGRHPHRGRRRAGGAEDGVASKLRRKTPHSQLATPSARHAARKRGNPVRCGLSFNSESSGIRRIAALSRAMTAAASNAQ